MLEKPTRLKNVIDLNMFFMKVLNECKNYTFIFFIQILSEKIEIILKLYSICI